MSLFIVKDLTLSFAQKGRDDKCVLNHINTRFPSRGIVSICGKSGSGKSTFLNVLFGIEKPTKGQIKYLNLSLYSQSKIHLSQIHNTHLSMVFQHYNLFSSFTALENVIMPLLIRGIKKDKAIKKAETLFKRFSLENIMNQKADTLSGGEKQRVAILRSLITSPKSILADEPTGALDKKNSKIVMDMFKEISKDILIIMVSHNLELVNKYSDRIITLKDGSIESDVLIHKIKDRHYPPISKIKQKDKWSSLFVRKKLKENLKRNIVSAISSAFGFLAILIAFGFSNGSKLSQENALKNNYSLGYAKASTKSYYEIPNSPLMYEKSVRPSIETIDEKVTGFNSIKCVPNLDYAFSPYPVGRFLNEEVINFEMVPLYDTSLSKDEVLINDEMAKLLSHNSSQLIGKKISISSEAIFSSPNDDYLNPFIKDIFSYSLSFEIKEVVNEFSFLNSPKIYYSLPFIVDFLKESTLINISRVKETRISVYDFIADADDDNVVSSYCYNIFVLDKNEIDSFFTLIEELNKSEDSFKIESIAYEIKNSYASFISSFSDALFVFVIIAFVGVNFIIGMLSLSSYIESKKEAAILTCLGAKTSSIISIYLNQNNILILSSYLIAIGLSFPASLLINKLVSISFGLENLISIPYLSYFNIPLLLPVSLLVIAVLISTLFTLVPLLFYKNISITNELRDE